MTSSLSSGPAAWFLNGIRGGPPLRMEWRNLLFENYAVDPERVRPKLPKGLTLDTFENRAWLSVVPFRNVAIRPIGVPHRWGLDLPELNLRTYVTHNGRKGVYFFSLDAEGILAIAGARLFHGLPYYYARISLRQTNKEIRFRSRRLHPGVPPALYETRYSPTGSPFPSSKRKLTQFLLERYRFFIEDSDGDLFKTEVRHRSWTIRSASVQQRTNSIFQGSGFERPKSEPVRYFSEGLSVRAFSCRPVRTDG